jgi:DNA-directed RNA polymerase specialized sigma24 family protein
VTPEAIVDRVAPQNRFPTTHWSVVLSCGASGSNEPESKQALSHLCKLYWRPIFSFICHSGYCPPDAQDLTQDFFIMVLRGGLLRRADPARGRFRSLLLKTLVDFLNDAKKRQKRVKRGGTLQFVRWDDWMSEAPSYLSISRRRSRDWPAERIFDVRWAASVVEHALKRLGEECEAHGRRRVFEVLKDYLAADRDDTCYASLSKALGTQEAAVKTLLHRLRMRYRMLLRSEVLKTVESPEDLDDELRHLCAVLADSS